MRPAASSACVAVDHVDAMKPLSGAEQVIGLFGAHRTGNGMLASRSTKGSSGR